MDVDDEVIGSPQKKLPPPMKRPMKAAGKSRANKLAKLESTAAAADDGEDLGIDDPKVDAADGAVADDDAANKVHLCPPCQLPEGPGGAGPAAPVRPPQVAVSLDWEVAHSPPPGLSREVAKIIERCARCAHR
eukprot:4492106-Pyramimonas_sp.AAC.1